ncbi:MAG: GntP family permease [Muricauda sp.]|jgi:GntP family gluconate:H+ symporter|nr:GntP family permease [Allomuricauda sp.]MBO6533389.1 GntP family permease [Allomuricauda sp.]MBO6589061.1 GntP family permease [Allomuricauda sp.]MBO6618686.1 GntP family permease [Allomuricauda sp.]MBO6644599.1 GntP family permease [Allomuricauda sp.]MBO6746499.1 GntP family permease [Allomuricauda sp.]
MEMLVLGVVILFIIVATVKFKMHPIFSLTIAAVASGFLLGLAPQNIMTTMAEGFGKTLSGIGLVIAFGTVIGIYLEKTRSTQVLANSILKVIGLKRSPLAINLAGFVISIPVYCDSGYIILSSLNKAISKKTGIPALVFAIALATGLYSAHVFVPPTPGPLAAAAILEADLGMVLIFGLLVAIPVSISGYFWARFIGKSLQEDDSTKTMEQKEEVLATVKPYQAFLPLLVPIILIAMKSIVDYPTHPLGEGWLFQMFNFLGSPVIALLIGVFFAFALGRKVPQEDKKGWVPEAFMQAGAIVLITGAGGAFGAILRTMDIASIINLESSTGVGGLLIAFVIAAVLKTAQGSSTVAIITTSAIIAPLLETFGLISITDKALAVLAIGAGAMTVSHINDSYFWVVSQFSHMKVKTALKGHTLGTLVQGTIGLLVILFLYAVV